MDLLIDQELNQGCRSAQQVADGRDDAPQQLSSLLRIEERGSNVGRLSFLRVSQPIIPWRSMREVRRRSKYRL
jgi:hypothetical protein